MMYRDRLVLHMETAMGISGGNMVKREKKSSRLGGFSENMWLIKRVNLEITSVVTKYDSNKKIRKRERIWKKVSGGKIKR